MAKRLHLFVDGRRVATLEEQLQEEQFFAYSLQYLPKIKPGDCLSLSLPVRDEPYLLREVPLCLRQNFPEGDRLTGLMAMSRVADVSNDMQILSLVGQNAVGRVTVSESMAAPLSDLPHVTLHDASRSGRAYFEKLYEAYGFAQGVSGAQRKALAQMAGPHPVLMTREFLIKGFDSQIYPALAENEYWCLRAAQRCGIRTAQAVLSEDFSTLIIKRFDISDECAQKRFMLDEVGALRGFSNIQKYQASYQIVADAIEMFSHDVLSDWRSFFQQLAFVVAIKNGDAHIKNFAFLTRDAQTRLAPAYNLVCTGAYVKADQGEFENPALALDNERSERHWWNRDRLMEFGRDYLLLDRDDMESIFMEIESGLGETAREMCEAKTSEAFSQIVRPKMLKFWTRPFDLPGWGDYPVSTDRSTVNKTR